MEWKFESLMAYVLYRILIWETEAQLLDISLNAKDLSSIEKICDIDVYDEVVDFEKAKITRAAELLKMLIDKNELFYVLWKEKKQAIKLEGKNLRYVLKENKAEGFRPLWWPAQFETYEEARRFVEESTAKIRRTWQN